jgi:hypothetical protein
MCSAIITGIFTLIGVLLGYGLNLFTQNLRERKLVKKEFQQWKLRVLKTTIRTYLPVVLHDLREFLLRNPQLLGKKEFNDFYDKWLTEYEPMIEEGEPVNIPSLGGRMEELKNDLEKLNF